MPTYSTYILGKDDYTIDPHVKAIKVKSITPTSVGYEIIYTGPKELIDEWKKFEEENSANS